jgi:hypothetical protein
MTPIKRWHLHLALENVGFFWSTKSKNRVFKGVRVLDLNKRRCCTPGYIVWYIKNPNEKLNITFGRREERCNDTISVQLSLVWRGLIRVTKSN